MMIAVLLSLCVFLIGQSAVPLLNTDRTKQDVYTAIPEAERQDFRTAVERLITLEKSGGWAEVYDRFYLNDEGLTKEQFVDKRNHLRVTHFVLKRVYFVPPQQAWVVSACAVFSPPLPVLKPMSGGVIADFRARHTPTGWRFDAPPAVTMYKDSPSGPRSCAVPSD